MRFSDDTAPRRFVLQATLACLFVLAASTANGCTVLIDTNARQCETTTDCDAFIGTVCNERHVCVEGGTACANNEQCVVRHGGETHFCKKASPTDRAGTCTPLLSPQCPTLLAEPGDIRNDDVVLLAVQVQPSWFAMLKGGVDSVELVRRDFRSTAGGLPPIRPGGKPRPVAFLSCDVPFDDESQHRPLTDHLVDVVGVSATIGPLPGDWMSYQLSRAIPRGNPTMITASGKFPGFEDIPGTRGLFFTIGTPIDLEGKALAFVLSHWEKELLATGKTSIRVAYVSPATSQYVSVADSFRKHARFNGKSAVENRADSNFEEFAFGDAQLPTEQAYADATAQMIAFKPDVIVCDYAGLCADIPQAIEGSGQLTGTRYVLGATAMQTTLGDYVGTNEELRKRILGTRPGRSELDPRWQRVVQRHLRTFNEPTEATGFALPAYDMAYFLHYAVAAVGDQPLTGANIGKAMLERFKPDGVRVNTYDGGASILRGLQALAAGQTLDIDGCSHWGRFDETGQGEVEGQVWCVGPNPQAPDRVPTSTGMSFVGSSEALDGTNTCF